MTITVPGRVNLIGEHIDYHHLPVLPIAIERRVSFSFEPRSDRSIQAESQGYPPRRFPLDAADPFAPGDWGNYLKAAVQLIGRRWPLTRGLDLSIHSNLPLAAGLSSSSALMTGAALALLYVNDVEPSIEELMQLLPEGEQFVGTRGGGMDHAAVLAAQAGCALLVRFAPFEFEAIPIPQGWAFLVAHSLIVAEKSGAAKAEYNARRTDGLDALQKLGLASYRQALDRPLPSASQLTGFSANQRDAFVHVTSEAQRVESAVTALRNNQIEHFGQLLSSSHASLRDHLRVSHPALDELVECALAAGALGARLTGAGFGGCAVILCRTSNRESVAAKLVKSFYADRPGFNLANHLIFAEPSDGALSRA